MIHSWTRIRCLAGAVSVLGLPAGAAAPLALSEAEILRKPDAVGIQVPNQAGSYFLLYRGAAVDTIHEVVDLELGTTGVVQLWAPWVVGEQAGFFRVARVPVDAPLDVDGDGLDDLYELHRSPHLDPLNPADGAADADRDGVTNREEYVRGEDPLDRDRWRVTMAGGGGTGSVLDLGFALEASRSGFRLNRVTGRFVQVITVVNTGPKAITGPVQVLLEGLTSGTTLYDADGSAVLVAPDVSPYARLTLGPGDRLEPGSSASLTVEFDNPAHGGIRYTPHGVHLASGSATDAEGDGLPDAWEALNGYDVLRQDNPAAALRVFTMLE